jgi:dethiobiotin synthetase
VKLYFVITGTDTGIGKTVFSAGLVNALGACYWKPIQSGIEGETDSETVARLACIPREHIFPEAWKLKTPVSPHLAAKLDHVVIQPQTLSLPQTTLPLVIEGAGGLLVPLTEQCVFADIFAHWQVPVILCARTELGTINHTLLSLEAMRRRSIRIYGVVHERAETQQIIADIGNVRVLGRLPLLDSLTPTTLQQTFRDHFPLSIFQEALP